MSHAETLGRYLGAFVDELVAAGLRDVCLCPGSRSAPLALTFARHPGLKVWTHLDERSCAYFALGMAKAYSVDPVAILCSSGTAAANFAPAVIEAHHAHVPLLVLTADRPPELQGLGANQTIDQVNLYGSAVKWFVNMPLAESSDEMLRYARMVAQRSFLLAAREGVPGPVHLNFPFREPLIPTGHEPRPRPDHSAEFAAIDRELAERDKAESPAPPQAPSPPYPGSPAYRFVKAKRPLLVCGPHTWADLPRVRDIAGRLGVPILADPLSGVRSGGPFDAPGIIGAYDAFLREPGLARALRPDIILRFGAPPTSKALASFLLLHRDVPQVQYSFPGSWDDPDLTARRIEHPRDPGEAIGELGSAATVAADPGWLAAWRRAEEATLTTVRSVIDALESVSDPSAVLDLADVAPEGHTLVAGNSMPVRDIDAFWPAGKLQFIYGNRGASGIDGVVSTAMGVAARAHGQLVLVIGDLSFYHDMNGLLAARRFGLKATIVLLNNDGGGIFSFLPQNDDQEHFEALFGTPHGLDFAPVAQLYGLGWQSVTTRDEYRRALLASFEAPGVQVIEVKTDRRENLALHERIWREVAAAVADVRPA